MDMRLGWVTDLHLNDQSNSLRKKFIENLLKLQLEALLITGDLFEGEGYLADLKELAETLSLPLYFVLGNHDYYQTSIRKRREEVQKLNHPLLHFLTDESPCLLTKSVALTGHDGWADATVGNFLGSTIRLRDYKEIEELQNLSPNDLKEQLHLLGKEAAASLKAKIEEAFEQADTLILAMHSPPFVEACRYGEKVADEEWAPHFVSGQVGEMLIALFRKYPQKRATLFAGHCHNKAHYQPLDNLTVYTGEGLSEDHLIEKILVV